MLELTYAVEPDVNRVFDGRELARQLIHHAYALLVPYAGSCPACTDDLFSVLANEVIEKAHGKARQEGGVLEGWTMAPGDDGPDKDAAIAAHLKAAKAETRRLLTAAGTDNIPHGH